MENVHLVNVLTCAFLNSKRFNFHFLQLLFEQPTIQDLEKENKTLRGENESLHDDLNNMKARLVDLERYVQYLVAAEEKRGNFYFYII